jgi:hypothetical protein
VQTSSNSTLGITFNDSTTFNLSANSKIIIDNYVYEEGGSKNAAVFDIAKGTVAFVAAAVAKTGDMTITTPTATLGIRGTTGLVEVPEDGTATSTNNVAIKLYPDADGRVGRIEVNDRTGARLGALTQGASGFTIRPGTGGARFAAVPLTISREQVARDQGFVRQVHAAQSVGRQIVTEQRAFRRANPGLNNRGNQPANQPSNQPGQQRPNGAPGQNRPGQPQQGAPNNRQGTQQPGNRQQPGNNPQQPGRPGQPGQPSRPGQPSQPNQGQPGAPNRQGTQQQQPGSPQQPGQPARPGQTPQHGGAQPGGPQRLGAPQRSGPGLQRPGLQRPQLPGRRPAPARGKDDKKRR